MQLKNETFLINDRSKSKGLNTADAPSEIGDYDFSAIQNIQFSRFGFGPRRGTKIVGTNQNTGSTGIKNLYVYSRADGESIRLRCHTTFLEVYDSIAKKWYTLVSGFTSGKRFGFAPFNKSYIGTIDNQVVFCNGTENYSEWNGAIGHLLTGIAIGATTIDLKTDQGQYWSSSGSGLLEGSDTFSWSGRTGDQLTGVTGVTVAHLADAFLTENPDVTTHSALPKMNILLSALGRIYGSKDDVVRMYYSEALSHTNFTSGNNYGDPGLEDFPEGNGPILAITPGLTNTVRFYKERGIYELELAVYSATSATSNKRPVRRIIAEGEDTGCASPLGIATAKQNDYFIATRGGLHILGLTANGLIPQSLTSKILPSLEGFNNDEAAVGYDPNLDLIYASTKGVNAEGDVATNNDTTIVYDIKRQALSIWKGLGFSCFAYDSANRTMLAGDFNEANVYELNVAKTFTDQITTTDFIGINSSAITKRFHFKIPAKRKEFNTYMVMGWILPGTKLKVDFRYDFGGVGTVIKKTIEGDITKDYVFRKPPNTLGKYALGTLAFGADINDYQIQGMYPFLVFLKLPIRKFHNIDVAFYTDEGESNAYWISYDGFTLVEALGINKRSKI